VLETAHEMGHYEHPRQPTRRRSPTNSASRVRRSANTSPPDSESS
jgi:hypothetical protein